jgi:hypothetical protein
MSRRGPPQGPCLARAASSSSCCRLAPQPPQPLPRCHSLPPQAPTAAKSLSYPQKSLPCIWLLPHFFMENNPEQAPCPPVPFAVGCRVRIKDIVSRPEFNGCTGKILEPFDSEKQRWPVRVVRKKGVIVFSLYSFVTFPKAPLRTAFSKRPTWSSCKCTTLHLILPYSPE